MTHREVCALSARDRIALALALGDADVDLFARFNGISPADARCTLQARRTRGRRPSCATTVSVQAP